jgi:hypothetical protein
MAISDKLLDLECLKSILRETDKPVLRYWIDADICFSLQKVFETYRLISDQDQIDLWVRNAAGFDYVFDGRLFRKLALDDRPSAAF